MRGATKGRTNREKQVETFLDLLSLADEVSEPTKGLLKRLGEKLKASVPGDWEHVLGPVKHVSRAMDKVHEEYGGDYCRLVRNTLRCRY